MSTNKKRPFTKPSHHDQSSFSSGDLGMGRGLKPGAISLDNDDERKSSFTEYFGSSRECSATLCTLCRQLNTKAETRDGQSPDLAEKSVFSFPSFAGVPFGTSLRQHRELYEVSRKGFHGYTEHNPRGIGPSGDCGHTCNRWTTDRAILADQLKLATKEVDVLQNELEVCQSRLQSKYKAIKIIQHQAAVVNSRFQENEEKMEATKTGLEKEVNSLQFELERKTSSLIQREETWSERYNRVSLENTVLMSTLQARAEEVQRLHTDKIALIRERDELLARMDVKERLQYEEHWTTKNDQAYLQHTLSEQLAVLGACMCRATHPDPCQCARIAAILTKENGSLKDEMKRLKQKLVESVLVSDSFRQAFEEQLRCNSTVLKQMSDHQKRKNCNQEKAPFYRPNQVQYSFSTLPVTRSFEEQKHNSQKQRTVGLQVCQPIPDSSSMYEDLLNDKSEALAHQRLISKLLAQKTQDLEQAVKRAENLMNH